MLFPFDYKPLRTGGTVEAWAANSFRRLKSLNDGGDRGLWEGEAGSFEALN